MDEAETSPATGAEVQYLELVEAISDYAVYRIDRDGLIQSWNSGAERIEGFSPADVLGQHFSILYDPREREARLPEGQLEVAADEGRYEGEVWHVRKDGARIWTHITISAIKRADGETTGFAVISRDFTERQRAQSVLNDSAEQFRRLVLNVVDYAIYMLSPSGNVSSWNLGAERIKGYAANEIIGEHFSRFYPEEDRARGAPQHSLEMALKHGHYQAEGWRVRRDGTKFWASVVIDAIRGEDGELLGFAKITRDITERLEQQQRLDRAREELFQAQKVEAIGQLTGGVAHDFNNLLMVVLGSLEALGRRTSLEERDRKLLDNALQAAQRGSQLTQRMLAFARKQELEQKPVDLPELVQGMSELLSRTLEPAIVIETRFPEALPQVFADPNQIDSALLNLAVNARDAMPQGGPLVISARELLHRPGDGGNGLPAGRYVCLAVEDSGEGMDEQTLARATDPFFTTKGIGKGTGLGLSMVQGIAEQSGGRLVLKSRAGHGTTAEIWLPVVEDGVTANTRPVSLVDDVPEEPVRTGLKVIAVDDDALVLLNTAMMLEDLGHVVLEATSGEQALQLLAENPDVDLVITDQAMPRMTGLELAAAIGETRPSMPIILASGYADIEEARQLKLPRLAKPFGQNELERVLRRVFEADPTSTAA